jgi:hypothetical protein
MEVLSFRPINKDLTGGNVYVNSDPGELMVAILPSCGEVAIHVFPNKVSEKSLAIQFTTDEHG